MKKCDCLQPDCPYCHPGIVRHPPFDENRKSMKENQWINVKDRLPENERRH